ncbi:MAG: zinc ribbon domain-containing protein [Candidatus Eremiobacteraeota bacterium]|nr:zinc ribbon domain-containing protein [Candidatus Eremiobacteraeota bacterium]
MEQKVKIQPTLSPITNALIYLIREIIQGNEEYVQYLKTAVNEMTAGLEAVRADLEKKKEESDPQTLEGFKNEILALETAYERFGDGLDLLSTYFENPDVKLLKEGEEKIIRSAWEVSLALQRFDTHYLLAGPSRFLFVNALIHLAESLKSGEVPRDILPGFEKRSKEFFEKAIEEHKDSKDDASETAKEKMKNAYHNFIEAVEIYAGFAKSGDPDDLDRGIELFIKAYEILDEGLGEYKSSKFLERPTTSPYINLLLNTFDGIKQGIYPARILEDNINLVRENFKEMKEKVYKVSSLPMGSAAISEELPAVEKAFEGIEAGLTEAEEYLVDEDAERLDRAEKSLIYSARELYRLEKVFKQIEATEGKVYCMQCQHPNPAQSRICEKCGARLPRFDEDYATYTMQVNETPETYVDEVPLTENIARILGASDDFVAGKIGQEEFESVLDWMEGIIEEGRTDLNMLPSINIDNLQEQAMALEDEDELLDEEDIEFCEAVKEAADNMVEMVEKGLNQISDGIALMKQYITSRSEQTFNQGKNYIIEGAKTLYMAQVFEPIKSEEEIIEDDEEEFEIEDIGEVFDISEKGEQIIKEQSGQE